MEGSQANQNAENNSAENSPKHWSNVEDIEESRDQSAMMSFIQPAD